MDQQTLELLNAITAWHGNRTQNLQTILDAPADTELRFQGGDGKEIVIPGNSDKAKGFRIGIIIAMEQFGKLPFTVNKPEQQEAPKSENPAVKELADQLNGSEYPLRLSALQQQFAKERGLVVVYGVSDDLMMFDGAIRDEFGVYDGGTALVDAKGILPNRDDIDEDDDLKDYFSRQPNAKTIEALWCDESFSAATWAYRTDIPHAIFDVMDRDEAYCRGIVFALDDLK